MHHQISMFNNMLIIILVSLPVLFLFRRIGLSPVASFAATGVTIGHHGLQLCQEHYLVAYQ